eukprot:scaffold625_cov324-Pavlova_lutheri.AAC.62
MGGRCERARPGMVGREASAGYSLDERSKRRTNAESRYLFRNPQRRTCGVWRLGSSYPRTETNPQWRTGARSGVDRGKLPIIRKPIPGKGWRIRTKGSNEGKKRPQRSISS